MKTSHKAILIAAITIVAALVLSPMSPVGSLLWQPAEMPHEPSGFAIGTFMVMSVLATVALGLAVAFLFLGLPAVRRVAPPVEARAIHLSIVWLLGSVYFHDNLHMVIGEQMDGIAILGIVFHGSAFVVGALLAWTIVRNGNQAARTARTSLRDEPHTAA